MVLWSFGLKIAIVNGVRDFLEVLIFEENESSYDHSKADFIAPTIQMLTFKNAQGEITDRLPSCDGSKIMMAGGDFSYHIDWDTYLGSFSCGDATLEVSYSQFGMDEWKELPKL